MRYYDDIRQAYEHGRERSARQQAEDLAMGGDYDAASDRIMAYDPSLAGTYSSRADVGARREIGRAVQGGDYERASTIANSRGDFETATALSDQQRLQVFRGFQDTIAQIDAIDSAQGQGYEQFYQSAQELARQRGTPERVRRFVQSLPQQWNPRVTAAARAEVQNWRNSLLTAEQQAQYERYNADRELDLRRQEETERRNRADEELRRSQEARLRSGGGGGGGSGSGGSNGPMLAGAEQRGRIVLSLSNIVQAQRDMEALERQAIQRQGTHGSNTPFGQDWGARVAEAIPFDGGSVARFVGGDDYQAYESASRTFEQSVMPIFSGSAVTESEAQRFVRANLPRMNDTAESLRRKAQNRARIINAAAVIVGGEPPFPEAGVWTPSGGLQEQAPQGGGGGVVTVNSPAEAANLPAGTRYRTPDGDEYVR